MQDRGRSRATALGRVARIALVVTTSGTLACGTADEPHFAPSAARAPSGPRVAPTDRAQPVLTPSPLAPRSWYTIDLPPGALPAVLPNDAIDSVHVLDAAAGVRLTVLRPMPGESDLAAWTAAVDDVFVEHPVDRFDDTTLDGVPARLGVSGSQLRWTAVADGYGLMLQCFGDAPHDEAWLHAHCDPTVRSIRLVRPITE